MLELRDNREERSAPQLPPLRTFVVVTQGGAEEKIAAHTVEFMPNGGVFFIEGVPVPDGRILNRFVAAYQVYQKWYEIASVGNSSIAIN